jgi:hypothetical protein
VVAAAITRRLRGDVLTMTVPSRVRRATDPGGGWPGWYRRRARRTDCSDANPIKEVVSSDRCRGEGAGDPTAADTGSRGADDDRPSMLEIPHSKHHAPSWHAVTAPIIPIRRFRYILRASCDFSGAPPLPVAGYVPPKGPSGGHSVLTRHLARMSRRTRNLAAFVGSPRELSEPRRDQSVIGVEVNWYPPPPG